MLYLVRRLAYLPKGQGRRWQQLSCTCAGYMCPGRTFQDILLHGVDGACQPGSGAAGLEVAQVRAGEQLFATVE